MAHTVVIRVRVASTALLWRTLHETNSRSVRGVIHRALASHAQRTRPTLGQQLIASGAIWPGYLDERA